MKHIHGIADIVEEDVIKFVAWSESLLELFLVWERDREFEGWISLLCDFHNLSADVNAFARIWLDNSQKIAGAATNREDLFARLYQKTKKPALQFIIISVAVDPILAVRGDLRQMAPCSLAPLLQGGWSPAIRARFALV